MYIFLFITLIMLLILPLTIKKVENHLELFLLTMGMLTMFISNTISIHFFMDIFANPFLYMITAAVLIGGAIFKLINRQIKTIIDYILCHINLRLFIFIMIIVLGLLSSIVTAIIAALLLVEIIELLPVIRNDKIKINIISCFSIGLGSILTPIGEPLSTIVSTKLNLDFWFLFNHLSSYVIPTIVILALIGSYFGNNSIASSNDMKFKLETPSNIEILIQGAKIFLFIIALEMLGSGFSPLVDNYIIHLNTSSLYLINMSSAVLDNATLAAAEISIKMSTHQVTVILLGLLISGGMMIPGNIPNIISASKLKIKSSEWISFGVPLGVSILAVFYVILFLF